MKDKKRSRRRELLIDKIIYSVSTKASIIIYKIIVDKKIPTTYFNLSPEKNMCARITDRYKCDVVDKKIRA